MASSTARVPTAKPAPYMKQLCRHFGHRVEATFDDERGEIQMPTGLVRLEVTAPGELTLIATAAGGENLETLTGVIGSHLERFGGRDELAVAWVAG